MDEEAIAVARENYKIKFPGKAKEVNLWNDLTFLNKAKIAIKGKPTRTAIVLLGKEKSEHFISPAEAMPDYDLSNDKVKVTIAGKILDIDYARLLARNKKLTLEEIMMPDKVQKKQPLTKF